MKQVPVLALGALTLFAAAAAHAATHELRARADVRLVAADSNQRTFTDGGLSALRHADGGLEPGDLYLDLTSRFAETWAFNATLLAQGDADRNPLDLTEAWLQWRPYPAGQLRFAARAGAFYPELSLENVEFGWLSPYAVTSSALNSWVGEELRIIGLEGEATWTFADALPGARASLAAGAYGWNDGIGIALASRGFAVHDRQTPLFGDVRLGRAVGGFGPGHEPFHEIDDRVGWYALARFEHPSGSAFNYMRYDNRGDPAAAATATPQSGRDFAWPFEFDAIGASLALPGGFTVVAQALDGETSVAAAGPVEPAAIWQLRAAFLLVARDLGPGRLSLRHDDFRVRQTRNLLGSPDWNDDGSAWSLAWRQPLGEQWTLTVEALQVDSRLTPRAGLGFPVAARERAGLVQLAWRHRWP